MKLKIQCIHILVTAVMLVAMSHAATFGRKPNIVFILADDMGYGDLSCFGSDIIHTPNIDSLADQGMKFKSFYVHNRCTPTRAALMTGSKAMQGRKVDSPIHDMFIVSGATIRYKEWKLLIKEQKPGGSDKNQGRTDRIPAKAGSLFNLRDDIGETMDVSAKHPEKVQQLTKMAEAYLQEFQLNMREPGYIKDFDAESAEKLKREYKENKKQKKNI